MGQEMDNIIRQNQISSNQAKNFQRNYSQTIKLYDFDIPTYNEFPGFEFEEASTTNEESIKVCEENPDIPGPKVSFKTIKFFRGRKRINKIDIAQLKVHDKKAKDNILRKFNVFFLGFVIELANEIIFNFGFEENFIDLDYDFKKNITQKRIKELRCLTFGKLLCNKISKNWKKFSSNENEKLYKIVIKNENIEKIFSEKFMTILYIFLNSQRNIKIGDTNFYLSSKIEMFDNFLLSIENKYINDDLYIEKIKEVIKKEYLVNNSLL